MRLSLATQSISADAFLAQAETTVVWLGMAGALINARGTVMLIDPLLSLQPGSLDVVESGNRLRLPLPIEASRIPHIDAVLYTHADFDHFGPLTARTLNEALSPLFLAPKPVAHELSRVGVPADRLILARDYARHTIGDVEVEITPALHDWQETDPWQREDACGYLLRTPDGTIWHPGDTRLIDELLTIRDVDVLFFDVAAVDAHLGPEGSARLAATSGARLLIAYHYGTFDLPPGDYGSCDPDNALPYLRTVRATYLQPDPGQIIKLPKAGRP